MPDSKSTFTDKLKKEKFLIYDFSARDISGKYVWYFLAVPFARCEEFLAAVNLPGVKVDIKQFGKILASGDGKQPPETIRRNIMRKYAAGD